MDERFGHLLVAFRHLQVVALFAWVGFGFRLFAVRLSAETVRLVVQSLVA
jgi:hypothetical protein